MEGSINTGKSFLLLDTRISTTKERMVFQYFTECLRQAFSQRFLQCCQFHFLGIFIRHFLLRLRNRSTYFFCDIGHWFNLTILLYFINIAISKKKINPHYNFSFPQFLSSSVILKIQNHKFHLTNFLNRHITFQYHSQNTFSSHNSSRLLKNSSISVTLFLIPFYSDSWVLIHDGQNNLHYVQCCTASSEYCAWHLICTKINIFQ